MCTEKAFDNAARRRRAVGAKSPPFVVGIVGAAGSGKSTLARALAGPGTRLLDADRFGHEITDGEPGVRAALAAEYGADVYRGDGTLDRARVAARVFSDPAALARLNALVHPHILDRLRAGIAGAAGVDTVVVDAALLLDWGFERECDAVIAVVAPEAEQVDRLMRGRDWSAAEARARLAAQDSSADLSAAADVTLDNQGTAEALARAAREAVSRLRAGAAPHSAAGRGGAC